MEIKIKEAVNGGFVVIVFGDEYIFTNFDEMIDYIKDTFGKYTNIKKKDEK